MRSFRLERKQPAKPPRTSEPPESGGEKGGDVRRPEQSFWARRRRLRAEGRHGGAEAPGPPFYQRQPPGPLSDQAEPPDPLSDQADPPGPPSDQAEPPGPPSDQAAASAPPSDQAERSAAEAAPRERAEREAAARLERARRESEAPAVTGQAPGEGGPGADETLKRAAARLREIETRARDAADELQRKIDGR
jgi:hypothetical protein